MSQAPYILVTASSLAGLICEVQLEMAKGYEPCGGPFSAGAWLPPHGGLVQAMVLRPSTPAEKPNPITGVPHKPRK